MFEGYCVVSKVKSGKNIMYTFTIMAHIAKDTLYFCQTLITSIPEVKLMDEFSRLVRVTVIYWPGV